MRKITFPNHSNQEGEANNMKRIFFKKECNRVKKLMIPTLTLLAIMFTLGIGPAAPHEVLAATSGSSYTTMAMQNNTVSRPQTDRWEGTGDTWKLKDNNGGYVVSSWFQDLDGSWYLLGSDGIMFSGLITDQSTGKTYLLNTNHDGTFGRMLTIDGSYNINGKDVYIAFNQSHDGTYGAITSGLNEARGTGIKDEKLDKIPTDTGKLGTGGDQYDLGYWQDYLAKHPGASGGDILSGGEWN